MEHIPFVLTIHDWFWCLVTKDNFHNDRGFDCQWKIALTIKNSLILHVLKGQCPSMAYVDTISIEGCWLCGVTAIRVGNDHYIGWATCLFWKRLPHTPHSASLQKHLATLALLIILSVVAFPSACLTTWCSKSSAIRSCQKLNTFRFGLVSPCTLYASYAFSQNLLICLTLCCTHVKVFVIIITSY